MSRSLLKIATISILIACVSINTVGATEDDDWSWWDIAETGEDIALTMAAFKQLQNSSPMGICIMIGLSLLLGIAMITCCESCCEEWSSDENQPARVVIKGLCLLCNRR